MNSRSIFLFVIILVGIPVLLLVGQWSATDPKMAALAMVSVVVLFTFVILERSAWLLIPLTYYFVAPVTALPGGFALRDIAIGVVAIWLSIVWSVKHFELRVQFGWIEGVILLQYLFFAQAFVRNPAGLSILGSGTVGGRPYFEISIQLIMFIILSTQVVKMDKVQMAAKFLVVGGVGVAALQAIANIFPGVGAVVGKVYAVRGQVGAAASAGGGHSIGRKEYLQDLVKPLFSWILALTRPLGLVNIRRPFIVLCFIIVVLAALLSGFRSLILWMGMMYVAAAFIRHKIEDIIVASAAVILLLSGMVAGNGSLFDLPISVQRTLSFLPGEWDSLASDDAESSANWRFEMWELGLLTDEFIQNKLLGDGYGFSYEDLQYQAEIMTLEVVTPEMMQEHFMRAGDWHSGPVDTINRVGVFGLLALTFGMVVLARYAKKMIRLTEGTSYYVCTMFVGLQMIVYPFYFYLVIGAYQEALVMMTFTGGMLRLVENSMRRYGLDQELIHSVGSGSQS